MSLVVAFVVGSCAIIVWLCALQMRRVNKVLPAMVFSAAFLAINATFELHDGVMVPVGSIKAEDMFTVVAYIQQYYGTLDEPTVTALRQSIPTV